MKVSKDCLSISSGAVLWVYWQQCSKVHSPSARNGCSLRSSSQQRQGTRAQNTVHSLGLHVDSHSLMPSGPHTGARIWENKTTLMCFVFCLFFSDQFYEVFLEHKVMGSFLVWHEGMTARWEGISKHRASDPCHPGAVACVPLPTPTALHLLPRLFAPGSEEPPETPNHANWWE